MNWETLKNEIYYVDGALRDIYVLNTTKEDWKIWADFVSNNYKTAFYNYETEITTDKIDYSIIQSYWDNKPNCYGVLRVYLDKILINSYPWEQEIESDICPREFNSIEDHERLMEYMKGLSKALNKEVILTMENSKEIIFISINKDLIVFRD